MICINIFLRCFKNIIKILLLEGLTIIAENFKHVLTNYLQVYEEPLKGHPFYSFVKNDLGKPFEELIDNDKYVVSGSTAEGRWALVPSLRISIKDITTSSQNGYYIVYLFKEDMTGVYLSLNFGARKFHEKYGKNNLKHAANNFRKILQEEFEEITNYTPMDLSHRPNKEKGVNSKKYEDGDIFNIYYPLDSLNSDEKIITDFKLFLKMYDYLYEKRGTTIFTPEELIKYNIAPIGEEIEDSNPEDKKPNMDLSDIFKKIRDSYENGKYGNLSQEDENILKYDIIGILNSIDDSKFNKKPYSNFPHSGIQIFIKKGIGESNRIKIYIGHEKCNNFSVDEGLYLLYSFSEDGSRIQFSLSIGSNSIDSDDRAKICKSLNVNPPMGFLKRVGKGCSEAILRIEYIKNDLGKNWLERDLKNLYLVYLSRIDQYNNLSVKFINNKPTNKENNSKVKFHQYLMKNGFVFSKGIIENYLLSLKVKPFIILTGNSGTGKTKLSWLFADYLNEKITYKFNNNAIVPVGANWTENRNIVGYYNVLTKSYQHTQSLDLLLDAGNDEYNPYFLILDEMNLSHVERYFSDFLSAMESREPIPLHKDWDKLEDENKVPENLKIPPNVFIVGTVNVDETTYMFSPKVLDRANVLEFSTFEEISIGDYVQPPDDNQNNKNELKGNIDYLENPLSDIELRKNTLSVVRKEFKNVTYEIKEQKTTINESGEETTTIEEKHETLLNKITDELTIIHDYLKGSGFEFGYRTVNEILAFMTVALKYEKGEGYSGDWNNWNHYFDAQILQKILPKLHGSQLVLGDTLDKLLAHCLGSDTINENPKLSDITEATPYPDSAKKLIQMKNTLEKQRYVSFIN